MTTTRHGSRGALSFLTAAFVLLVACLLGPPAARAQWTPPDAANNISNTNTGNVGINITVPSFKFEVRGSTSRVTAGFTGDGDSIGYAGIRIAAFTTTSIANNRISAFNFSMRKDTWYGGDGSGPSFVIETTTKGGGFAAPFLITPTNDIILNSGRGAGGPAGSVPSYGNVGIGTHTPAHKLDVVGNVNASGLCLGGTCKSTWAEISGGGGTSSQWTTSGTSIHYTGGNVGIGAGMNSPTEALMVNGKVSVNRGPSPGPAEFRIYNGGSIAEWAFRQASSSSHNLNISKGVSGTYTDYLTIDTAGNVGVGTTAPAQRLHVFGGNVFHQWSANAGQEHGFYTSIRNNHFTSNLYFDGQWKMMTPGKGAIISTSPFDGNAFLVLADNTSRAANAAASFGALMTVTMDGKVGVGTTAPTYSLDINGGANGFRSKAASASASDAVATFENSSGVQAIIRANGNIGVGTTSPAAKMDVRVTSLAAGANTAMWSSAASPDMNTSYVHYGTSGDWYIRPGTVGGKVVMTDNGGTVGIGTASPNAAYKLDVAGNVNVSGLCLGGTCKSTWAEISGGGGTSSQWDDGVNSSINYGAGHVGIGTTTPIRGLQVSGFNGSAGAEFVLENTGMPANSRKLNLWGSAAMGTAGRFFLRLLNDAGSATTREFMSFDNATGNVGVGTANPTQLLDVSGVGEVKARAAGSTSAAVQLQESDGTATWSEWQQYSDRLRLNTHDGTTRADVMSILPNGNVGIAKANPAHTLDVGGSINASGAITGNTISANYQDVAEWVPSTQKLAPGTVVILDAGKSNHVVASATAYDTKVAGVVSERPGVILGVGGDDKLMVATTGRVRVRVDATRGGILVGDLLVTSEVEGVAMKSVPVELGGTRIHRPGTIIGKALEPLPKGVGEILVLLSLQ